jgi:hypothetical protein
MSSVLMAPVKLDALLLAQESPVVTARADFTALPYNDGTRDVNADTANLSENIISPPFAGQTLILKAGMHLHWSLPDALTRGNHSADGTDFPAVPNRWLVLRSRALGNVAPAMESGWVVESDYLHPEGATNVQGSISVPVTPDPAHGRYLPHRFQGRKLDLSLWQPRDPAAEYLDKLTAVGYGEPTFAALYPNCRSVFGFHDQTFSGAADGVQYDVIGWHSRPGDDPFAAFMNGLATQAADQPTDAQLLQAIQDRFNWQVTPVPGQDLPRRMLCYGRLTFHPGTNVANPAASDTRTDVAVAGTGTEALSAYLAATITADAGAKAKLEDQLEAVQLSGRLQERQLDIGPAFYEARHEKGFVAVPGGTLWTVRPVSTTPSAPASAPDAQEQQQVTLPDELAHALDTVNTRQSAYDQAAQAVLSLRRGLFADWYKYMVCAYPPDDARDDYPNADEVRYFVEHQSLAPLQEQLAATGSLALQLDTDGSLAQATDASGNPASLAATAAEALIALRDALAALNGSEAATNAKVRYTLRPTAAPRYWQPREPVVLLAGATVEPSDRHGRDGLLPCSVLPDVADASELLPNRIAVLTDRVTAIAASLQQTDGGTAAPARVTGIDTWTQQPWNPFLLEWQVEVLPLARGSNLDPATDTYQQDFITGSYALEPDQPDLLVRAGQGALLQRSSIYSGSSILTPQAPLLLGKQLDDFLSRTRPDGDGNTDQDRTPIAADVYRSLQQAQARLNDPAFHCMSQALGGFNDALMIRRQTLQLPIADPLGFDDDQPFTGAVGEGIARANTSAPQPLWDFNPLRTGALRLLKLRLIDTFGQVNDVDCRRVVTAEALRMPGDNTMIGLPPRLAQPARINLRWLSAADDDHEMNDHPATTPVCGWLLPNNLDSSLMVYDNAGKLQGLLDQTGTWRGLAGDPVPVQEIANPHLRRLVRYMIRRGAGFLRAFLSAMDTGLVNIDPESFAQHKDLALLMGRPVALVRASLNMELQGLPAVHQGWTAFRLDLGRERRDDDGFPNVSFPLRLGEYRQLNDGLVGYWLERDGGYDGGDDAVFYAPESEAAGDSHIRTHADDPAPILMTLADPPLMLSMLVDPRGVVHATTGIQPAKSLSIPPEQYTAALAAIEVAFLTAPILTDAGSLNLPLPVEAGYTWSWLPDSGITIGKVNLQATFSARQELREGWLKLTPATEGGSD